MKGSRRYLLAFAGAVTGHAALLGFGSHPTPATAVEFGTGPGTAPLEVGLVERAETAPAEPAAPDPVPPAPEPPDPEPDADPIPPPVSETPLPEPAPEPSVEPVVPIPSPSPSPVAAAPLRPARAATAAPRSAPATAPRPAAAGGSATGGRGPSTGGAGTGGHGDTRPAYLSNPRPAYPAESRRAGEEGAVYLTVQVDPGGRAVAVALERSSGFPRLDRAATEAVRRWRFRPATRAGVPVTASVTVPVRFDLH